MRRVFCLSSLLCLSLAACNSAKLSGVDGLAFGALAGVVPPPAENVQLIVKISNISPVTVQLNYDGCAATPIFHSSGYSGPVVFDPRPTQDCGASPVSTTLDPGDALQITGGAIPNLPAGTYFVTALIKVNGVSRTLSAGSVSF